MFAVVSHIHQLRSQDLDTNTVENKVLARDAAWCWFSDPRAVYFEGEHKRLFFAYINSLGDVMIASQDQETEQTAVFNLHEKLQVDDHNVPSILFLPDGKLLTFYTEHGGRFFMRKSKNPEDISAWEEEKELNFDFENKRICYSHPVMLSAENNRIYMFYRLQHPMPKNDTYKGWWQCYAYSDDLGETWSAGKRLIDSREINNAVYMKVANNSNNRIDFLFTDGHPKIGPSSVYHMYYEKDSLYQTDGTAMQSLEAYPVPIEQVNKVYDVKEHGVKSWIWDVCLDGEGSPVLAYTQYPDETDHRYHYVRWDGERWQDQELCRAGPYITRLEPGKKLLEGHYSGGVVLDHNDPKTVYLSKQINGVYEVERWQLNDAETWGVESLTSGSKIDNVRPFLVKREHGKAEMVLWMQGTYRHYTDYDTNILLRTWAKSK
ncbi:BNR-4 repeat-containing protein [Olivibacter sp. SDN3]|uniref:BNR-4 repeat-containing protein n=1 Tax=Olivibacter sp. SDN3 TaxID=2764720 RepID=UPI0016512DE1|nr:BNR-4 repeat-containing protein [Olivibacter sp. SDN3]QNL51034.1 BNR-4 repeat-containing protein [Olivibacter sp. SDN3]